MNALRGVALAAALVVASCTTGAPTNVALTAWFFDFPPAADYQQERIDSFVTENPSITVRFDHSVPPVGEGGFEDKLTSALATGTAPDVFPVINPQAIKLISKGQMAPIDDEALKVLGFNSLAELKASRLPGVFDSWSDAKGIPYALHWELSWLVLYCNDDHFRAGGVDPDKVRIKTWDDLLATGKKIIAANPNFYKDSSGHFKKNFIKFPMYVDDTWSMQVLTTFLAQSGGSVLSADKTASAINTPQAAKAVQTMITLSRELGDPNVGPTIPGEIHAAFSSGEQTCDLAGQWMWGAFLKPSKSPVLDKYRAYGMPSIDADKPGNVFWGWAWTVNPKSSNKVAAWKLIRHLQSDPQGEAAAVGVWTPLPGIEKGWGAKQTPYADAVAAAAKGGQAIFVTEKYAEIARLLRGKIEAMAQQGADVKSTLDGSAKAIDLILKK